MVTVMVDPVTDVDAIAGTFGTSGNLVHDVAHGPRPALLTAATATVYSALRVKPVTVNDGTVDDIAVTTSEPERTSRSYLVIDEPPLSVGGEIYTLCWRSAGVT